MSEIIYDKHLGYAFKITELTQVKVTWETCPGGQRYETVYVLTPEAWNMENEGFIGCILRGHCFFTAPLMFVYDGLLYARKATPEELKEVNDFKKHKARMKAILTLLTTQNREKV